MTDVGSCHSGMRIEMLPSGGYLSSGPSLQGFRRGRRL